MHRYSFFLPPRQHQPEHVTVDKPDPLVVDVFSTQALLKPGVSPGYRPPGNWQVGLGDLADLPFDVLCRIFAHLPPKEQSKTLVCTSKVLAAFTKVPAVSRSYNRWLAKLSPQSGQCIWMESEVAGLRANGPRCYETRLRYWHRLRNVQYVPLEQFGWADRKYGNLSNALGSNAHSDGLSMAMRLVSPEQDRRFEPFALRHDRDDLQRLYLHVGRKILSVVYEEQVGLVALKRGDFLGPELCLKADADLTVRYFMYATSALLLVHNQKVVYSYCLRQLGQRNLQIDPLPLITLPSSHGVLTWWLDGKCSLAIDWSLLDGHDHGIYFNQALAERGASHDLS